MYTKCNNDSRKNRQTRNHSARNAERFRRKFPFGELSTTRPDLQATRTVSKHNSRYTPTSCFETFPLPECVGATGGKADAIAAAARELDELRNRWLNPPEWTKTEVLEFPGSADGPWARYVDPATVSPQPVSPHPNPLPTNLRSVPGEGTNAAGRPHPNPLPKGEGTGGIGTVRWPRVVPKDAECAESLKKRTLTNLYNQRPTWLVQAHEKLDTAVFAAYGWDSDMSDEELLERLLRLNLERAGTQSS